MSETQELLKGIVAKVECTSENKDPSGWRAYNLAFEDGVVHEVLLTPGTNFNLEVGKEASFYKTKAGLWCLDKKGMGLVDEKSSNGRTQRRQNSYGNKGENWEARQQYWDNKEKYEVDVRDPKIEFQSYFANCCNMYVAAIKPPLKPEQVDEMLDAAFNKAKELFTRVQKKASSD